MTTAMSVPAATSPDDDHADYLATLPVICNLARRRFAALPATHRDEAVAEAVAGGFIAYLSLKQRGRLDQVTTAGFVRNAVRAVAGGRRTGNAQAGCDVLSDLGRRRHGCGVLSLDGDTDTDGGEAGHAWLHEAVADRHTAIPDQVAIRVDGGRWLASLPARSQQMIRDLAAGEKAATVARRFGISPARLSQLRREWSQQWQGCVDVAA